MHEIPPTLPTKEKADEALSNFHTYSRLLQQQKQRRQQQLLQKEEGKTDDNKNAVSKLELNVDPWREIVLQSLYYATDRRDSSRGENHTPPGVGNARGKGRSTVLTGNKARNGVGASNASSGNHLAETTLIFLVGALDRYHKRLIEIGTDATVDNNPMADTSVVIGNATADNNNVGVTTSIGNTNKSSKDNRGDDSSAIIPMMQVSPESVLVDALWLIGSRLEPDNSNNSTKGNSVNDNTKGYDVLCEIIKGLVYGHPSLKHNNYGEETNKHRRNTLIQLLQTSLESTLLGDSNVISASDLFVKRIRKILTNMYYRQKKVNLMQEESEGYAKLLSFLVALPCLDLDEDYNDYEDREDDKNYIDMKSDEVSLSNRLNGDGEDEDSNDFETKKMSEQKKQANSFLLPTKKSFSQQTATTMRVRELIGAFDLDPNRVLDLTLDVLEGQLKSIVQQRAETLDKQQQQVSAAVTAKYRDSYQWDRVVRHAPDHAVTIGLLLEIVSMFPKENVSHLIGFKLSSYQSTTNMSTGTIEQNQKPLSHDKAAVKVRTTNGLNAKPTPKSLYLTIAILCSHCLLSLPSLVPHLQNNYDTINVTDDVLESYAIWKKEFAIIIKKKGVVSLNPSANNDKDKDKDNDRDAGGVENSSSEKIRQLENSCETNQLVQILRTLIQVGLDWEDITSLFCIDIDDSDELFRIQQRQQAEKVVAACCSIYPPMGRSLCRYFFSLVEEVYCSRVKDIGIQLCYPPMEVGANGCHNDDDDDFGSFSLLPCRLFDGPSTLPSGEAGKMTLLNLSQILDGPLTPMVESGCISFEPVIYCKLCRLVRVLLQDYIKAVSSIGDNDENDEIKTISEHDLILEEPIINLFQKFVIPSISLFPNNLSISDELWSVISLLPYNIRYLLYDHWRGPGLEKAALRRISSDSSSCDKPLLQIQSEVDTWMTTRWFLRRMSRDNVRDMGRQISKASHNNPLVLFTLILSHIESYDNFIGMVVDTFKYVGGFGLDVLGYCLLGSLGGLRSGCVGGGDIRSKVKEDGVSKAQWFSSLETFTGIFYKKFPDVNLHGLLSYLLRRLRDGHVEELGILQALLKETGGYTFADCDSTSSLSPMQLEGRCGTRLLKRETSDFGIVTKVNVKASKMLREVLHEDGFGIAYLVLLSQARSRVLFEEPQDGGSGRFGRDTARKKDIKLIGNLNDCCRKTMYILQACIEDFNADIAEQKENERGSSLMQKYAESFPTLGELHRDYGVDTATAWMLCRALVRCADNEDSNTDIPGDMNTSSFSYLKRFRSSSESMRATYPSMLPSTCWSYFTPLLFSRFFSLCIYDLYCPTDRYETEVARLKREVERLSQLQRGGKDARGMQSTMAASMAAKGGTQQQIRDARIFTKSQELDLERSKRHSELLAEDLKTQKRHCDAISLKIKKEKDSYLSGIVGVKQQLLTANYFLTYCVYPRCILSPDDALFCCRFVKELHRMETKGFFTLQFFDCVVNAVVGSVYCITEDEAANLGVLLEEMWQLLSLWRYDSDQYDKAVTNKPGATWYKSKDVKNTTNNGEADNDSVNISARNEPILYSMSHPEFIILYNHWHAQLGSTFIGGLQSTEYMHTRISLILLTRIVRHFPTKSKLGEKFSKILEPLQDDENPMQDIKTMAQAYKSQLSKIEWKEEDSKVAMARLEKERKEKERKKIQLERQKEISEDVVRYDERVGKTADLRRRQIKFTPADPSRTRAEPYIRSPNIAERVDDKNNDTTTILPNKIRWQPSSNNSNNNIVISNNNERKRGRSPERGGSIDHVSDSKRVRTTRSVLSDRRRNNNTGRSSRRST